jgi:hypothetical protein
MCGPQSIALPQTRGGPGVAAGRYGAEADVDVSGPGDYPEAARVRGEDVVAVGREADGGVRSVGLTC